MNSRLLDGKVGRFPWLLVGALTMTSACFGDRTRLEQEIGAPLLTDPTELAEQPPEPDPARSSAADVDENGSAASALAEWSLERSLTIGDESRPQYALSTVSAVLVGGDELFVVLPSERTIRVFSRSDGTHRRDIGRPGAGPGEFGALGWVALTGDSIWASDGLGRRLTIFDRSGEVLRTEAIDVDVPYPFGPGGVHPLTDGWRLMSPSFLLRATVDGTLKRRVYFLISPADTVHRTFAGGDFGPSVQVASTPEGQPVWVAAPLYRSSPVSVAPDGASIVTVDQDRPESDARSTYRVTRWSPSGDAMAAAEIAYGPRRVSPVEADSLFEVAIERLRERADFEQVRARARNALQVPDRYLPVSQVLAGVDNTLWIQPGGTPELPWLVLSPDLRPIATLRFPDRFRPLTVREEEVWGVETDELDIPRVVGFTVVKRR